MNQNIKKLSLTPLQTVMLMENLKNPSSEAYWQVISYEIPSYHTEDDVTNSWSKVIKANPALRTKIDWNNGSEPMQVIDSTCVASITTLHYEQLIRACGSFGNWVNYELQTFQQSSLDTLQKLYMVEHWKDGKHLLVWLHHHILVDGWSMSQILDDFFNVLNHDYYMLKERPDVEAYIEFMQQSDYKEQSEAYWLNVLCEAKAAERLSFECSSSGSKEEKFEIFDRKLSQKACRNIHSYSVQNKVTVSSIVMSFWGLLLNRYQLTNQLFVGSTFALRPYQLRESHEMNGMLINTLPVKLDLKPDISIKEYFLNTMDTIQDVSEYSGVPYSKLLQLSKLPGDTELFKSSVIFQNYQGGLHFEDAELVHQKGTSSDPLSLTISLNRDNGELRLGWDASKYQKQDLLELIESLEHIFEEIEVYGDKLIKEFNLTTLENEKLKNFLENELPINQINYSIDSMVDWSSDKLALSDGKTELSYKQVRTYIEQVSNYLSQQDVKSGDTVALNGEKGIEVAIGMFACWRIGARWCNLDRRVPKTRNDQIIKVLNPKIILNLEEIKGLLKDNVCQNELELNSYVFKEEDLAYFISTSGSTGKPKLVSLGIKGVFQIIESWKRFYCFKENQHILQLGSWTSDVYLGDLLKAWSTGGSLIVCDENRRVDMDYLYVLSKEYKISFVESTPHLIREFIKYLYDKNQILEHLKTIVVGSDVFRLEEKNEICNMLWKGVDFYNGYGLSECTIESVVYHCNDNMDQLSVSGMCPIGQPLPGTLLRIVDETGNSVAPGMIGELHIGGDQVMNGYVTMDSMDTSKIYEHNHIKYFMTGDNVRLNTNGMIEFYGREDQQVKIRGFRVELGEIENAFLSLETGMECFVTYSSMEGEKELVVFLSGTKDSEDVIREKISKRIPYYAIPRFIVLLHRLPRNSNGKIDRPLLMEESEKIVHQSQKVVSVVSNEIEDIVRNEWEMVLGRKVFTNKTFFDQGGHSLIVLKLFNQLRQRLPDYEFVIGDLFRYPTIDRFVEQLSHRIDNNSSTNGQTESVNKIDLLEKVKQGDVSIDEAMYILGGNNT